MSLDEALPQFGLNEFRPGQREVIESVMAGHPTLAVMPTGSGKSLCYQLPAVLLDGVTLVVSPLVSLIKDQVDSLTRRGIAAVEITGSITDAERRERLNQLRNNSVKLVYVAPERFRSPRFTEALREATVSLIAIDEAHCISEWGHDFRPDYLRLADVIAQFPKARVVALTATATAEVRADIAKNLGIDSPRVFVRGFDRPNLKFGVEHIAKADKVGRITQLAQQGGSTIVYAATRKNTEELTMALRQRGIQAVAYHAGQPEAERSRTQDAFMADTYQVLVATTAFGMGVDKSDVRRVIHSDLPRTLEAYYQESGRAGRDGSAAECWMLFNAGDQRVQQFMIDNSHPSAEVLRATYKVVVNDPSIVANEDRFVAAVGASHPREAQTALRILSDHGWLTMVDDRWQQSRPPDDAPRFDPNSWTRRRAHEHEKLKRVVSYAYTDRCRRRMILDYFGDEALRTMPQRCNGCDNCLGVHDRKVSEEELKRAVGLLRAIAETEERFGRGKIVKIVCGERSDELIERRLHRLDSFGSLKELSPEQVYAVLAALEDDGFLRQSTGEYPTLALTEKAWRVIAGKETIERLSMRSVQTRVFSTGPARSGLAVKAARGTIATTRARHTRTAK